MAEARRNWIQRFVLGALCLGACAAACAQTDPADPPAPHSVQVQSPPSGALAGRLTDLHSAPLAGVIVVLRNQATGAETHIATAKNGVFRFASLDAGEYTLEADTPQLGHGRLEGILITGGMEARVQAAMRFEPAAPVLVEAAAPNQIAVPVVAVYRLPLAAYALPVATAPAPTHVPAPSRQSVAASAPPAASAASAPSLAIAVTPPPAALRPVLITPSPALSASIAIEPLPTTPLTTPRAPAVERPPAPPATSPQTPPHQTPPHWAPSVRMPAQPQFPATPPVARTPAAQQHAALETRLETQSVQLQPTLALALPRAFLLTRGLAPAFAANAVAVVSLHLAVLNLYPLAPVAAAAERASPAAPAVATTVTATELQALPASGRRWQEFLLDTPAAAAAPDSTQPSFRASQESAEITIDGTGTRLAFGAAAGSGSGSQATDPSGERADQQNASNESGGQAWTGGRGLGVSEAAIHEVTTMAGNVEAEGLRSAGGRTAIHTESGAGAFHGQGFFFDRQNNWGAKNPFTQWVTETSAFEPLAPYNSTPFPVFDNFKYSSGQNGAPESYTPPDHEIVWGLGMGSQIRRDKLFWFAALDSYHRNDSGLAMVKHPYLQPPCEAPPCSPTGFFATPSAAQLQLLSAQLGLPSANPEAEALVPYSNMLGQLAGLLGPAPRNSAQWTGFARIDWQATERHRFTLEGTGANWNSPGGGLTQVSENYGNHSFGSSQASQQLIIARWEAYLTPNLLAVTQASGGRTILAARPDTPSAFEQPFLNGNPYGQLPQIVVDSANGFTIGNPARFGQGSYPDERLYHGQEMLDWVHNHLLVKAGFEVDHNADATSLLRNQTGTYHYSHVASFISDALAFETPGLGLSTPQNPHTCGVTNTTFGALPCYSSYSQTIGPSNWHLSTNDWAGYVTAQWQAGKFAVFSAGLRWELEQMPPPIAALANSDLSQAGRMPDLGNNWGPRLSLAIGEARGRWPILRLGYGMYYGRVANATLETALTQTGSTKPTQTGSPEADLSFFIRPTDGYTSIDGTSAAPPFPDVLNGPPGSVVAPGATEFAPNFRNPEVHQAVAAIEQPLPGHVELTAAAMLSLGRRLPVYIDTNLAPTSQTITYNVCDEVASTASGANSNGQPSTTNGPCGNLGLGPINAAQIKVPTYASWPSEACPMPPIPPNTACGGWNNASYQDIDQITSMANSTYEAAVVKITRYGQRGLSLNAHYTYAHAMDWNPGQSPMDPADFSRSSPYYRQEYGAGNLDVRHSAAVMAIYEAPWKLHNFAGRLGNGWMLSGIGQFHSGLPYTMRVTGSLPEEFTATNEAIVGLRPGINGAGGDNRVFGLGSNGTYYNIGRNTFRYPDTWKADMRIGKHFNLGEMHELEIMAESFNLFNHQNVTELETTGYVIDPGTPPSGSSASGASGAPPTLTFLTGLKTSTKTGLPIPAFGQPLNINGSDFYRERQIQFGLRMRF